MFVSMPSDVNHNGGREWKLVSRDSQGDFHQILMNDGLRQTSISPIELV